MSAHFRIVFKDKNNNDCFSYEAVTVTLLSNNKKIGEFNSIRKALYCLGYHVNEDNQEISFLIDHLDIVLNKKYILQCTSIIYTPKFGLRIEQQIRFTKKKETQKETQKENECT